MSSKTLREMRVTIRVAAPLRQQLEVEAEQQGRPLADVVRQVLIDHCASQPLPGAEDREAA